MKSHFCLNPFITTRQNAYDRISPCAFGPVEIQVNSTDSQQERWHHPRMQLLREEFSSGKKPSECKRCWDEESAGMDSLRLRTFKYHPTAFKDLVETEKWRAGPIEIVIKTSNVCNLACRSCAGWDSSYYWPEGKHYKKLYNTTDPSDLSNPNNNHFMQLRPKVHHQANLWTDHDLANVQKINFFGGEPLLDKQHVIMLQRLVDSKRAKDITLFYSTNCQQRASKQLVKLWSQFKRLEIFFSIDAMGEQFHYLRWPGDWDRVQRNLDWFETLPKQYPNVDWYFRGSQCVSMLNVASYWHTADWLRDRFGGVYFNIVDHPSYLRMTGLPDAARRQIKHKIVDDSIRQYLHIEPYNPLYLKQMIIWTKRQDLYRNQDFTKIFPETYELIQEQWNLYTDLSDKEFQKPIIVL